ncbi:MAG: FtsX-like permease family protein [Bacteroidota bacterium]
MILNYLKLAVRFFFRKKTSSLLNLSSLIIGLFSFLFVTLYVYDELTFDQHNINYEAIHRITTKVVSNDFSGTTAATSLNLATTIKQNFPEKFQTIARFIPYGNNTKINFENSIHRIENIYLADQEAFNIFSYRFIQGQPAHALTGANKIVLAESTANRIFGLASPLGKTVSIDNINYEVTAVIENLPPNSDLPIHGLLSINPKMQGNWSDWKAYTYILLNQQSDASELNSILQQINETYVLPTLKKSTPDVQTDFKVQGLKDVHFINDCYNDTPKGNRSYVYFLSIVGILLLLIACFNYINLSVARSLERGKEVGVRKVFGANKWQLVQQYMAESMVTTSFAFLIAVLLLTFLLPLLNHFTNKQISILSLLNGEMLAVIFLLLIVVGILSSIYPSLYLSSLEPGKILKGKSTISSSGTFKDILIIIQFSVSIGMVICTILVSNQLKYLKNKDTGFQRENIVILKLPEDVNYSRVTTLKNELERLSTIEKVSIVGFGSRPGSGDTEKEFFAVEYNNQMEKKTFNCIFVDEDFMDVLNIRLIEGTKFTQENISNESFIVNETFVKQMGWTNPIGKKMNWQQEGEVIGVMKDYNYQSLYNKIEPLVLIGYAAISKEMLVRIKHPTDIELIQEKWTEVMETDMFDFSFLDENLDLQYRNDEKMLNLFALVSFMTSLLSFIGLFTLAYLNIQQRKKEIGIRKVLGASNRELIYLFTKKTLIAIGISFLIAAPCVAYLINMWSQNFVYRKEMSLGAFVFAGCLMLLIAVFTSSYNVFRSASKNPADSLRSE